MAGWVMAGWVMVGWVVLGWVVVGVCCPQITQIHTGFLAGVFFDLWSSGRSLDCVIVFLDGMDGMDGMVFNFI
jgi:hypothetical protein